MRGKNSGKAKPARFKTAPSMAAAAAILKCPIDQLKAAKRAGCPAFRDSRVFLDEYEEWITKTPIEDDAALESKDLLERRKLREQLLALRRANALEDGSIVTRADTVADLQRIANAMQSRLAMLIGEAPNWAGLQAHEIQAKAKEFVRGTHEAFHDATSKLYKTD